MSGWERFVGNLDFGAVYFTTQLLRCAFFSFAVIALVMLLRKTLCARRTFLRGLLWSLLLVSPFLGRLKLFYESGAVLRATWWMMGIPASHIWFDRIYMAGIFVSAVCIFTKRLCLQHAVARMDEIEFASVRVRAADIKVTPFTTGLLKPQIVLPRAMLDHSSEEEILVVLRHEQTHIRLGHLWCGLAWDLLRCLLWINPLLALCQRCFQADLEDICDRVCIQNGGYSAQEYGLVLLKSVRLLREAQEAMPPAVTFAGEKDFADMKRRIHAIAAFGPYRKRRCMCLTAAVFAAIMLLFAVIHSQSYGRYTVSNDIMVYQYDGAPAILSADTEILSRMIFYDDSCVYVEREAFEEFLDQKHASGDIYIVFGGFYKLPGLGGAAEGCLYESGGGERVVRIPYESVRDSWEYWLLKFL